MNDLKVNITHVVSYILIIFIICITSHTDLLVLIYIVFLMMLLHSTGVNFCHKLSNCNSSCSFIISFNTTVRQQKGSHLSSNFVQTVVFLAKPYSMSFNSSRYFGLHMYRHQITNLFSTELAWFNWIYKVLQFNVEVHLLFNLLMLWVV